MKKSKFILKNTLESDGKDGVCLSAVRKPTYYSIHKFRFNESGTLKKLEVFAYFKTPVLKIIESQIQKMKTPSGKMRPSGFNLKTIRGHLDEPIKKVVSWGKSAVLVRCYKYKGERKCFKLEVTRLAKSNYGRGYLHPVKTPKSLFGLIRFLTKQAKIHSEYHDKFLTLEEFQLVCEDKFRRSNLGGQLKASREK